MVENKKVSVIIPCYNCESLLGETLSCLENQTCKDFEVVCINDGSTDDTLNILKEFEKRGTIDMVIIDKENNGVSSARNDGIKAANGEFLLFLDSDDIYHYQFVEIMINAMRENDVDVAYCRLNRDLEVVRNFIAKDNSVVLQTKTESMKKLLFEMGIYGFYCYIYKKSIIIENGILFDENTKFGEDREFNWKYLCHCNNAAWLDMPLYGYRVNEQSVTKTNVSWRKTDLLAAVVRIENYLQAQECTFTDTFKSYMYARAMWAVAKTFAVSHNKEMFEKLGKEFDVKKCMRRTARDSNKLVMLASILYLVHPMLFYVIVGKRK